ncbi:DUF262 domain-containing protein [Methylobacterium nodulans]|uniref:DUF262 domain-containing protein n=1 Tax=Methylobacterium nodulans (strain LMG 21967 / CNCM I-2342 / ORS 2060) TaxID=460265 RepID=B8IY49_METNO|nr:DUF262 domain-containing protein [Methylobacterium nodulans]ACL63339.1 protein of unknown function DUF262 [Methylobacterium nodulans ORS 2060]
MTTFIQTAHELVGDLLSRQIHYHVPEHQRDYSWTEDEVSQFWEDIWEGSKRDSEHFLGPAVVRTIPPGHSYEIIDGQQRLTTTLILLAALRNSYLERGDSLGGTLQSTYFGHIDRRTRETIPKFTMNSTNNETFKNFIAEIKPMKDFENAEKNRKTKLSNKRLLQAYIFLKGKVDELTMASGTFSSAPLADIEDFLKEKLSVIQIVVSDEADAFALFETLNERGIELSILDLLKNHFFKVADKSRETVKQRWFETLSNLDENVGSKFIRHYWVSKNGRVQAGRLYRVLRDSAKNKADVLRLSEDLLHDSRLYSALTVSDDELWDGRPQQVRDDISTLKLLNASQCLPVLLAAHRKMEDGHFDRVLHLMMVMAVRYSLICQYRTGALEIAYADIAHKISSGELRRAGAVRRELSDLYPRDDDFRSHFCSREIKTAKHARFLLRALDATSTGGIISPVSDAASVNLEHIAPKTKNQHWSIGDLKGESYEGWVYRIGNQALLEKTLNHSIGNGSFTEKKVAFSQSQIALTKPVADRDSWTTAEIQARQVQLADLAVKCWRYDVD